MKDIVPAYQPAESDNQEQLMQVPDNVIGLVNNITQRFEGIYQYTGNKTAEKTRLYKIELTQALFKVRNKITEQQVVAAVDYFALNGGAFAPSVPEFIQVVLGKHQAQEKPPELAWFDASKALPQYTPQQYQDMGKKGVDAVKALLKKTKHSSKK